MKDNGINGVLDHDSAQLIYTGLGATWTNDMNLHMNHGPSALLIARPVDPQPTTMLRQPPVL